MWIVGSAVQQDKRHGTWAQQKMKHMERDGEMEKWEIARKRGETGFTGSTNSGL